MNPRLLGLRGFRSRGTTLGEYDISPRLVLAGILADDLGERFHPAVFLGGAVGVEVDGFAVGKPHAEAFFYEHVALFFFCEG